MKTMRVIRDGEPLKPKKETKPSMKTLLDKATTEEEKRALILEKNPLYYTFGTKLTPTNPYKENQDENT